MGLAGQALCENGCPRLCFGRADDFSKTSPSRCGIRLGTGTKIYFLILKSLIYHASPNKHVAFGHGTHLCLGQHLARMEIRALFKELLSRVHDIRLIDQYRYTHTAFVGGLKSLPIQTS